MTVTTHTRKTSTGSINYSHLDEDPKGITMGQLRHLVNAELREVPDDAFLVDGQISLAIFEPGLTRTGENSHLRGKPNARAGSLSMTFEEF